MALASLLLGTLAATAGAQQADAGTPDKAPRTRIGTPAAHGGMAPVRPLAERLADRWRWRSIEGPGGVAFFSEVRAWKDGGLIAVDDSGLLAYDGYEWRREAGWDRFSYEHLREVVPQKDGLLAITASAIVTISSEGVLTTLRQVENPYRITKPCRMPDGTLLVGIEDRIFRVDDTGLHDAFAGPENAEMLAGLARDAAGTLWVCTDLGIQRRVSDTWEIVSPASQTARTRQWVAYALAIGNRVHFIPTMNDDMASGFLWDGQEMAETEGLGPSAAVTAATTTPEGDLIVALQEPELRIYHDGAWSSAPLPGHRQDHVQSLCLTPEGRLAIVFSSGDLAVCDLRSMCWEQHDPRDVGAGSFVSALENARAGGVWVGTSAGIARWDGARFTDVAIDPPELGIRLSRVTALCEDDQDRLWVGSGSGIEGVACLDRGRWTLRDDPDQGVGKRFVHAIRRDGEDLWFLLLGDTTVGWNRGGLVRLRGSTFTHYDTDVDGVPIPRCYDLLRRADGTLLAGVLGGLLTMEGDGWKKVENGPPITMLQSAFALREASDGSLLVGLGLEKSGLYRLDGNGWSQVISESGRRAQAASFTATSDGHEWFASTLGLFMTDGNSFHDVSGLLPARTMWPLLPDGDRGLWIGMLGGGLARFCPVDHMPPHTLQPGVQVDEDGEAMAHWYGVDGWGATPAEELRYRVTLDGVPVSTQVEEQWSNRHMRRLDLGRLPAGSHEISIEAVDSLGNREEHPVRRSFLVGQGGMSVFSSLPVIVGASLTLLLAIGWALMNWMTRLREREQAQARQAALTDRLTALTRRLLSTQEDERRSLSRELHDNLGQICTALCIDIQRAARQDDVARRTETLDHALGVARDMLDRVRRMSFELRPLLLDDHGLEHAVSVALADFTGVTGVDVQSDLQFSGPEAPKEVAGHIYRILQETLTNVARHARAQTVDVLLVTSEESIALTVSDDGQGFVPDALPLQRRFGLLGMRERAELMGGAFRLQSSPHGGTSIHVSIPLKRSSSEGRHAAHPGNDSHG